MQTSKHPIDPEAGLQTELARLRALHHVHDAARILIVAMPFIEPDYRLAYGT